MTMLNKFEFLIVANSTGRVGEVTVATFPFGLFPSFRSVWQGLIQSREVLRDKNTGLAQPANFGEPGKVLSKIVQYNPYREFNE
jgi:hypothetical protein